MRINYVIAYGRAWVGESTLLRPRRATHGFTGPYGKNREGKGKIGLHPLTMAGGSARNGGLAGGREWNQREVVAEPVGAALPLPVDQRKASVTCQT